jgi:hypothetical protein
MTNKRTTRSKNTSTKQTAASPNPRDKKQNKSEESAEETRMTDEETIDFDKKQENANDIELGTEQKTFVAAASGVPAKGDLCGGPVLWANMISTSKGTWTNIDPAIRDTKSAYTPDDKYSEDPLSLHNVAAAGKNACGVDLGKVLLAEGWKDLFRELYETTTDLSQELGNKLSVFGLRLAMTAPNDLFNEGDWVIVDDEKSGLQSHAITEAWTGAYLYFGAPWKNIATFPDYMSDKKLPAKENNQPETFDITQDMEVDPNDDDITFSDSTKASSTGGKKIGFTRQLFIQKEKSTTTPIDQVKKKKWNESRKFGSFIKIRTSKLKTINRMDQETEFLEIMQETCTKLWTIDPKLVVYPWKKGSEDGKPIQSGKAFPSNRDAFAEFTERVFLKRGENVWIRLHVGHNKNLAVLKEDKMTSHFRQKDMLVYKDNLQVKTTAKAGWLLGSHSTVLNPRDLEEALALLPEMKNIPVEIRMDWITVTKGDKLGLKAAHILCEWENTLLCRRSLNQIYGKKVEGYPLGRNMRFVPNITDQRFITTQATRKKVENSVRKQRLFATSVSSAISYIISDLDFYESHAEKTLRQALMQMRSKTFPTRNLFLAVDTSWNGTFVSFLFKKDLEKEVNAMLPALPLVLQAKLGPRVWNWFNEEAKINTAGYWWDPKRGIRALGDDEEDSWGDSLDSDEDTGYWSSTSTASGLSRMSTKSGTSARNGIEIEPFNIDETLGKNEYEYGGDDKSVGAYSTVTTKGPSTGSASKDNPPSPPSPPRLNQPYAVARLLLA